MTKTDLNALTSAFWLIGLDGGWKIRGYPKWLNRKEFFEQVRTAHELASGGTFRGPLVIYSLIDFVEELSKKVTPPIRFSQDKA